MTGHTDAWRAIEAVVLRDHLEYCADMTCNCDEASAALTTKLYRAVADEVSQ